MFLAPAIAGTVSIASDGPAFLAAFESRVKTGLLAGRPNRRSNYAVVDAGPGRVAVRAGDWWTAVAVGLNDVALDASLAGRVHYQVRYRRWAAYVVGLCAVLGCVGLAFLLSPMAATYFAGNPGRMVPGFTVDENLQVAWAMVLFWGFVWPWLLIALHKRPLRRLLERIIREVDGAAASQAGH